MAERKAVNKWYPPDWDPSKGSINQYRGQHPLRDRARKLDQGILVIRFEMPFNIWCGQCERMIAKGVRFNAEKKCVGKYFTTKIWEFTMKCPSCSNVITVQTDPKNTEYVVVGGGRRKVEDFDVDDAEVIEFMDDETRAKINADPMFALDVRGSHKLKADLDAERIRELIDLQSQFEDDYATSRKLRSDFRTAKRVRLEEAKEAHRDNLPYPLLPASKTDELESTRVWFGNEKPSPNHHLERLSKRHATILPVASSTSGSRKVHSRSAAIELAARRGINISSFRKHSPSLSTSHPPSSTIRVTRKQRSKSPSNGSASLLGSQYDDDDDDD
ncbi:Splicing factor YJU2 [Plasmodiophora brassicae]|uniref:Splicing factor YJU2 n=1 Tax=Plasmodiophora brassicae TaxID=37360 RepID=A0A3P3YBS5_PLABS|nr:unnamed protein product [Plasmodiophora brassicae]